jgi:hypothetical protein
MNSRDSLLSLLSPFALVSIIGSLWLMIRFGGRNTRARANQGVLLMLAIGAVGVALGAACGWRYSELHPEPTHTDMQIVDNVLYALMFAPFGGFAGVGLGYLLLALRGEPEPVAGNSPQESSAMPPRLPLATGTRSLRPASTQTQTPVPTEPKPKPRITLGGRH